MCQLQLQLNTARLSDIVKVNSITINGDRKLCALPPLLSLLLTENLANRVPAGTIWAVQRLRQRLQHIRLLNVQLRSHLQRVSARQIEILNVVATDQVLWM